MYSQAPCPNCKKLLATMGHDFRPPKRNDRRAWEAARVMAESGYTFNSCGCKGPGYGLPSPSNARAIQQEVIHNQQYREDSGIGYEHTKPTGARERSMFSIHAAVEPRHIREARSKGKFSQRHSRRDLALQESLSQ